MTNSEIEAIIREQQKAFIGLQRQLLTLSPQAIQEGEREFFTKYTADCLDALENVKRMLDASESKGR